MRMSPYSPNIHSIPKNSTPPFQIISQLYNKKPTPNTTTTEESSSTSENPTDMDSSTPTQQANHTTSFSQEADPQLRISMSSSYSYDQPEPIPNWNYPAPSFPDQLRQNEFVTQQPPQDSEQRDSYHSSEEDYIISPHPLDSPSPDSSPPSGRGSSILLNTIPEHQEEQLQSQYKISIQTHNVNAAYTVTSTSPTTARSSVFPSRNPTRSNSLQHPSSQSTAPSSIHTPDHLYQKSTTSKQNDQSQSSFTSQQPTSSSATTSAPHTGPKDEFQAAKEKEERLAREWVHRYDEAQPGGRGLSVNDLDYLNLKAQFQHEQRTGELFIVSQSQTRELHEQEMRRLNQRTERRRDVEDDVDYGSNVAGDGGVAMNFNASVVEENRSKRRRFLGFLRRS